MDEKIDNEEIKNYKSKLKQVRVSKSMTQADLSKLSGIDIKSISLYEQYPEKINKAAVERIVKLSNCLDCDISDIIELKYIDL